MLPGRYGLSGVTIYSSELHANWPDVLKLIPLTQDKTRNINTQAKVVYNTVKFEEVPINGEIAPMSGLESPK
jgi:hypothetical protein